MEEEIKILDEDVKEYEKEKEEINSGERCVTVGDVITIQLILCIIIAITIVVLNIVKPDVTKEIMEYTKSQLNKPYQMSPEVTQVVEKIREALNV